MNASFKSLRNHSNGFVAPADAHRHYKKNVKQRHEDTKSKKRQISKIRKRRMPKGMYIISGPDNCTELPEWQHEEPSYISTIEYFEDMRFPTWQYNTFSNKPGSKKSRKHEEAEEELGDELFSIFLSKVN